MHLHYEEAGSHKGTPVALSTRGLPVSKFTRCSGARVQVKDTPAVSILSFTYSSCLRWMCLAWPL